jgi:hypothetical protein
MVFPSQKHHEVQIRNKTKNVSNFPLLTVLNFGRLLVLQYEPIKCPISFSHFWVKYCVKTPRLTVAFLVILNRISFRNLMNWSRPKKSIYFAFKLWLFFIVSLIVDELVDWGVDWMGDILWSNCVIIEIDCHILFISKSPIQTALSSPNFIKKIPKPTHQEITQ